MYVENMLWNVLMLKSRWWWACKTPFSYIINANTKAVRTKMYLFASELKEFLLTGSDSYNYSSKLFQMAK